MLFSLLSSLGLMWIIRFGSIFNRPRNFLKNLHPFVKELLNCSMCLGFWTGLVVGCLNFYFCEISVMELILFPFASSGLCWFLDSVLEFAQLSSAKIDKK